jgi:hypothetical protein
MWLKIAIAFVYGCLAFAVVMTMLATTSKGAVVGLIAVCILAGAVLLLGGLWADS